MAYVESISVNGTSLDNHKYAIETVTRNIPGLKGSNLVPAMDHGSRWRQKRLSNNEETWNMWVSDNLASTGLPPATVEAQRASLNANLDEVIQLLRTNHAASGYDAPLQVVRKMKSDASSPSDIYRVSYGELIAQTGVDYADTEDCARFGATINYTDPRWYECNSGGTKTVSTLTADGNPGGTAIMTRMTITLTDDDTSNPYIQNVTTGSKLTWNGGNPSGNIVIDTTELTAKIGGTSVVGNIDRTGSTTTDWFVLRPGVTNDFTANVPFSISYTKAFY